MTSAGKELLVHAAATLSIEMTGAHIDAFVRFYEELHKWNRKINLTAIRGERDCILKHFVDSLTVLPHLSPGDTVLDLGSGGGFPIIPLKIMQPTLRAVSVDAVEKKILFQRHVARTLHFTEYTALHVRGEQLAERYGGYFDKIVSRAFSDLPYFANMAAPLLKKTGCLIAMKGREGQQEVCAEREALAEIGFVTTECTVQRLPESGDERCLVILEKKLQK